MIYGATSVAGKKILHEALRLGYQPILGGRNGQELVELSFQTGRPCCIFTAKDSKQVQTFLKDIQVLIFCDELGSREHKRLLKACIHSQTHYIDLSNDLFSYNCVLRYAAKFEAAGLTAIPGLHSSVILADFVAATLKSHLTDASALTLACSESFTSIYSMVNRLQKGSRVLEQGKLRRPQAALETLLVPFDGSDTLTVAAARADILAAWQATRIPNISFFCKAGEKEIRLSQILHFFGFLLHVPFLKKWLSSQNNFFIRQFGVKPFHPNRYAVWGRCTNHRGKLLTIRMETTDEFDLALDVIFKMLASLLEGPIRHGVVTSSQILDSTYWLQSEHMNLTTL